MLVERHSGIALWRQIADSIRRSIAAGDYDETGMMPGEMALACRYGVNRHTVRAAIAALVDEGLLEAVQGRGTMVRRRRRYTFPIGRRTRFSEGLADQSRDLEIRLLSDGSIAADGPIAEALGVEAGRRLVRLDLLSLADGRPIALSMNYFVADIVSGMADAFRATGSVTRAFASLGIADYVRVSTDVSARLADEGERKMLKLTPGAVALVSHAVNATPDGAKMQYSETVFAADRVTLRMLGTDG